MVFRTVQLALYKALVAGDQREPIDTSCDVDFGVLNSSR